MKYGEGLALRSQTTCVDMHCERCDVTMCIQKEYMLALTEQKVYYGKPYFEDVVGYVCY